MQYLLFSTIVKIAIASHRTLRDAPVASDGGAQHAHACGSRIFVAGPTSRKEGCFFAGGNAVICRLVNVATNGVLSTPQYGTGVNQYQSFDAFWQKLSKAFSRANHFGFSEYTGWP